jgi:hypothetical protein
MLEVAVLCGQFADVAGAAGVVLVNCASAAAPMASCMGCGHLAKFGEATRHLIINLMMRDCWPLGWR